MSSESLHEPRESLSETTLELHRGITSLIEELEAVDWYGQRVDACGDDELREILEHNRDEEKEHACMAIEWLRRRDVKFDELLRRYLFREGSIVESHKNGSDASANSNRAADRRGAKEGSLELGSLQKEEGSQ